MTPPYFDDALVTLLCGDARAQLELLAPASVRCCVTSPPYFGRLRDYGVVGQIGVETELRDYISNLVAVFEGVRRALTADGTLWLNVGDSFNGGGGFQAHSPGNEHSLQATRGSRCTQNRYTPVDGFKRKELLGVPWRLALALQEAGWYLRADIIWHKPNPMPESVADRPTRAHEYLFLLTKSSNYFYDADAIREPFADARKGADGGRAPSQRNRGGRTDGLTKPSGIVPKKNGRNKRDVWTLSANGGPVTRHTATFPPALVEPCIRAGSEPNDLVLDPFVGSGTTLAVARAEGRRGVGIDLNPDYCALTLERLRQTPWVRHISVKEPRP